MECPKCKAANPEAVQFCARCHMALLFKCPSCGATQRRGGKCDQCGVDFAKYAAMLIAQEQTRADAEHDRIRERAAAWKQLFLLPVTGGFSLMKYFMRRG